MFVSLSLSFLSGSSLPNRRSSSSSETDGPQSSSLSKEAAMSLKISSPLSFSLISAFLSESVCTVWSGERLSVSSSLAVLVDGWGVS